MKVTKAQLETLGALIKNELSDRGYTLAQWENHYLRNKIGKNPAMRARWDALHSVPYPIRSQLMSEIYANGCNDEHIDTALRRIFA